MWRGRLEPSAPPVAVPPVSVTLSSPAGAPATAPSQRPRDPEKAKELVQRASDWQAANDTGTARDLLLEASELDPDNAEAHYRLGGLYLSSQPERARAEYQAAKRLDAPKYADVVDTILKGL
jgi:Tfp pilus assembly protein PilF